MKERASMTGLGLSKKWINLCLMFVFCL